MKINTLLLGVLTINFKKLLFFVDLSMGLTLGIQALLHPTLDSRAKISFIIIAIVLINWAVFTWLAYSASIKEKPLPNKVKPSQNNFPDTGKQSTASLLDVTTIANQVVVLLALVFLNILIILQVTETAYLVGTLLAVIILPLLVTFFANRRFKWS